MLYPKVSHGFNKRYIDPTITNNPPPPPNFISGNRLLHNLTSCRTNSLRVDMRDFDNKMAFAMYDNFVVNSEDDGFRLTVGGYSGTACWCVELRI